MTKYDPIIDAKFAEIEQFLDTPVKRYSSGMYECQELRLWRAHTRMPQHTWIGHTDILLVDEVLAEDASFRRSVWARWERSACGDDSAVCKS